LHGPVAERARDLLNDSRFRMLVAAIERVLDTAQSLDAHQVRAVLEEVDREVQS